MEPLILRGKEAFSDFRLQAMAKKIAHHCPELEIERISAVWVYFLETDRSKLSASTFEKIAALLEAKDEFAPKDGFYVTPRKGTISPWSSKATDIFRNCSIKEVNRVERGIHLSIYSKGNVLSSKTLADALNVLHDRMTEGVYETNYISDIFHHIPPAPLKTVDIMKHGMDALKQANKDWGLALSDDEVEYLYNVFSQLKRNPTDVELVMFGQVNSEHCRHKIFNADWIIDGEKKDRSLFKMIKNTHELHPGNTLIAYKDNSSVVKGFDGEWFCIKRDGSNTYHYDKQIIDMIMKVETHNHPTAISPYPGAATGVGGEIRDESATGTGSKSKAGLSAFMVSNLRIPDYLMPWEEEIAEHPSRLATPFQIMIDGPLGGAAFGNEFGRPQLCGLFKTYEQLHNGRHRGYHKPVMAAGGMGNIRRNHINKTDIHVGAYIIQIGGPAMRIGLGGGAASSMATGSNAEALDFNSVQRDNAEMQRRCQEVIDACIALGEKNPILSIHDIGAGGLSNGCPELVSETGGKFELRKIPNEEISMSPMEIWCCEAQERYVLAVDPANIDQFLKFCERERCPVAILGTATGDHHLKLTDEHFKNNPIDVEIGVILGKPPKMLRDVKLLKEKHAGLKLKRVKIKEAVNRILRLPAVANKTFLITITDRSVTGMVARDQMTGPYQTPIADSAVTTTTLSSYTGEAMAMGERTAIAVVSGPASGRMGIGEALTNIAGTNIGDIGNIKLSANWMCACGETGEDAELFNTVKAVGMELCPALGISIPVGKDSLSMRTVWTTPDGKSHKQTAPLTLVVSSFSPVLDVRKNVTADIKNQKSSLFLLDLGEGKNRLGCSALAQVFNQVGDICPDFENTALFIRFFKAIQEMVDKKLLLAYHDRSDGGLFVTLAEMAFGGRFGVNIQLNTSDVMAMLFNEELGAVIQVADENIEAVNKIIKANDLNDIFIKVGEPVLSRPAILSVANNGSEVFTSSVAKLQKTWSELTYQMQLRRDNPICAKQEFKNVMDEKNPGMTFRCTFDYGKNINITGKRPRMAILREQGINGHVEMAASFDKAGFESVDVHMTDLLSGKVDLKDFAGLVACGGFSYGDVLGAGSGWAKSVLFNEKLKVMFQKFFARKETFSLGICNGCQMMSQLKDIIPGAKHWPAFTRNISERFEARYVTIEILPSPSIFFKGMEGSRLGIAVAHGEGYADFSTTGSFGRIKKNGLLAARYIDNYGDPTVQYPFNPNGSKNGATGFTSMDGRATIMMPHPERGFRASQMSYRPKDIFTGEEGPWFKMFQNAREFVK